MNDSILPGHRHWGQGGIVPNNSPGLYTEILYTVLFNHFQSTPSQFTTKMHHNTDMWHAVILMLLCDKPFFSLGVNFVTISVHVDGDHFRE